MKALRTMCTTAVTVTVLVSVTNVLCCHLESLDQIQGPADIIYYSHEKKGERGRQNILNQSSGEPKVA